YCYAVPRALRSFPPRRSSDLPAKRGAAMSCPSPSASRPKKLAPSDTPMTNAAAMAASDRREGGVLTVVGDKLDSVDPVAADDARSEEHTSELQSRENLVCRLL